MISVARFRRTAAVLASGLVPVLFVCSFPYWVSWTNALPDVFEPAGDATAVSEVLGNLSLSLSSIAIACVIGATLILKERAPSSSRTLAIVLTVTVLGSCLLAVFAGFRFQLALAEQISLYRLDMARIQDRLEYQAMSALFSAGALVAMTVDSFVLIEKAQPAPAPSPRSTPKPASPTRTRKKPRPKGA